MGNGNNNNFVTAGNGDNRGAQGYPPANLRNNSIGQYRGGGNRCQQNNGWVNNQNNFDSAGFGGDFGDFDKGYFDAGQGYRQNYGNFGGPNRQFRGNGHGWGRRNGRGRYNVRGYGGRYPLADPQSQDLQTPTTELTPQANLQAPMAAVTGQNIGNALVNQQVQNVQQIHQGTTVSPNDQLVAAVAVAVESVGTDLSKAKKKKDKISDVLCFKCDTTGHFAADYYARLRKINDIKVDDTSCTIFFEEWATQEVHVWHLREVWVRFRGCPKTLRNDYLGLFAVGTLIGKTQEVDMAFTREHGIVRMRVLVINPDSIPETTDHFYDGEGFMIRFEVEGRVPQITEDQVMDDANPDLDDSANKGDDNVHDAADQTGKKQKNENTKKADGPSGSTQVNGASTTSFQVGAILCEAPQPALGCKSAPIHGLRDKTSFICEFNSAGRLSDSILKTSWANQVEAGEEDLPSPLAKTIDMAYTPEALAEVVNQDDQEGPRVDRQQSNDFNRARQDPTTAGKPSVISVVAELLPLFSATTDDVVLDG
ncbi:hypothetical protein ACQ4PT_028801 [Festuca glaucescens]